MSQVLALPRFEDFSTAEQAAMQAEVHEQLEVEQAWQFPELVYVDPEDVQGVLRNTIELVLVTPDLEKDHFGIVTPIRGRHVSIFDDVSEQSYPYLNYETYVFMRTMLGNLHSEVMKHKDSFKVDDIAFSVTSLLRTLRFQEMIASQGKLACVPTAEKGSTHCEGRAFDVDHGGGHVLIAGQFIAANPAQNFELWKPVREVMREVFEEVACVAGICNVIDEVPTGWGTFHVAVKCPTDTINT